MAKTSIQKPTSKSSKKSYIKWGVLALNVLVILGLAGTTVYFFNQYDDLKSEQSLTQDQKNDKLVIEVGKVYALPKDEKPVVALVADEEKFKQEYKVFTDAKKDDQLLLYEKAALAVLYRPSEKKVIATAPLAINKQYTVALIGPDAQTAATEATLTEKAGTSVKVSSKTVGVAAYPATTVVDVSGTNGAIAQQIAALVGGTVGQMPAGETAPEGSDIIIVVATPVTQ